MAIFSGAHIKEGDYYSSSGEYKVDKDASSAMHNSLMYKMCYYRYSLLVLLFFNIIP